MASYICGEGGNILNGFDVVSIDVRHKARVLKAPIETGFTSLDDKVIDPKEVVVVGYINKLGEYFNFIKSSIDTMHANRSTRFYQVMNDGVMTRNLILEKVSYKNESDKPDLLRVELEYTEALLIQETSKNASSPAYSSTLSTGRI